MAAYIKILKLSSVFNNVIATLLVACKTQEDGWLAGQLSHARSRPTPWQAAYLVPTANYFRYKDNCLKSF